MSTRKTPKGKAAADAAPPPSPARQSRRIRGVQAELDLNALEEIEKRNRQSRSRSRSASVSLPSQTVGTPRKAIVGGDTAAIGSPHVDFDQTASFSDGREPDGKGGDDTLRVVDFDASADDSVDLAPAAAGMPKKGRSPVAGRNKKSPAAVNKQPAAAAKTPKKTPATRRSTRRSKAASERAAVEDEEEELVVEKKVSVSPAKATASVSQAKEKKVISAAAGNSSVDEPELTNMDDVDSPAKSKKANASPAKKKVSVSPAKSKASVSPSKNIADKSVAKSNGSDDQDDEKEEVDGPAALPTFDDSEDEAAATPAVNNSEDEETEDAGPAAEAITKEDKEGEKEPVKSPTKKKVSISPIKSKASVSPFKPGTSVSGKPAADSDDSDDQDDQEDDKKADQPAVDGPHSDDEDEEMKEEDDEAEAFEDQEEEEEEAVEATKKSKVSVSPAKKRQSTDGKPAEADQDDEVSEDKEEAVEDNTTSKKKSLTASPDKLTTKSTDEKVDVDDEDAEEEDEEEDLFDDANSTMDVDEEPDTGDDDDEEPEAKVRRRNLLYEADVEDTAAVEQRRKKYKKSVVDDEFFRLEEMNEFLDAQDRLDTKRRLGKFDAADQMADLIEHYESENLRPRTWELSGEVTAEARDKDTLLDNFVDADFQSKAAPTITSEITEQLESIILKRIKDKLFDDVERKQRRDELVSNYRAKTAFDETVRRSLADVYEEEFQAAQIEKDVDEQKMDPVVTEIKKDMDALFSKLDALSHYQFVPSKVRPEVKIVKNVASLRAEEVGPMASTAAADALLAPEEVADHLKAAPKATDERDVTDRNRQRRKKKLKQRALAKKGLMNKENDSGAPNGFRIKKTIVKKGKVLVKGKVVKKRKAAAAANDATADEN